MEQFFTPYLFLGIFRLGLFVLFITVLYRLVTPESGKTKNSNYINGICCICAGVLVCFLLIQINSFDRFTILMLIFGSIALAALDLRRKSSLIDQIDNRREKILLYFLKLTDTDAPFREWLKATFFQKIKVRRVVKNMLRENVLINYGIPLSIFITAYLARVYFLVFDSYTLSDIWYNDLIFIKELNNQIWFSNQYTVPGEFALINLYKQLTGISSSLALQTFGILESALLAVAIFWTSSKFTRTNWFPGLIAALGFIFLYGILLLDLATITQHRSIFLALALVLPVFVMVLQPTLLSGLKNEYLFKMLLLFSGIAFIDLFIMLVVVPLFLLFALVCIPKVYSSFFLRALLAYGISLLTVFAIHGGAVYYNGGSFLEFINNHLFSISSYTHVPHLILPYPEFMVYVQFLAVLNLLLILSLWFRNKMKWYPLLTLSSLFVSLVLLATVKNISFDRDLLNQVISVFIPVFLAVLLWNIYNWVLIILKFKINIPLPYSLLIVVILIGLPGYWQYQNPLQTPRRSLAIENVLNTYSTIEGAYLQYSYAVVNNSSSAPISVGSHYFINYEFFNSRYMELDAYYAKKRSDEAFLKENPNLILPKSVFVFLYSEKAILNAENEINEKDQRLARENLSVLRQRNRQIKLFYKSEEIKIYEIINEPNTAKITGLLSKNNSHEVF